MGFYFWLFIIVIIIVFIIYIRVYVSDGVNHPFIGLSNFDLRQLALSRDMHLYNKNIPHDDISEDTPGNGTNDNKHIEGQSETSKLPGSQKPHSTSMSSKLLKLSPKVSSPKVPTTPTPKIALPDYQLDNITEKDLRIRHNTKPSKGERICKLVLEEIYGVPFVTVRPKFLKNPETGHNVELDCYNHSLRLAVEYNGEHHYKWPNFTRQSHGAFINQLRRAKYKYEMCEKLGIYLITVPYTVPHHKIRDYIIRYLPENRHTTSITPAVTPATTPATTPSATV